MRRQNSVPALLETHNEDCPDKRGCRCEKIGTIDLSKVLDWDQKPILIGETKRQICRLSPASRPWFDMDDGGGNHYHNGTKEACEGKLAWQTNLHAFAAGFIEAIQASFLFLADMFYLAYK